MLTPSCDAATSLTMPGCGFLARGVEATPHRRNVARGALMVRAIRFEEEHRADDEDEVVRI
jgi:hypothetical protein